MKRQYPLPAAMRQGFTLVELMVTLAVLAILATLAAPAFTQLIEQRRLTGAAEALYAQILFARSEAIKQSQPLFFEVTSDNQEWEASIFGDDDIDYTITSAQFGNRVQLELNLLDGETEEVFGFDPVRGIKVDEGEEPSLGITELVLSLDANRSLMVRVSAIGRVRVCTLAGNLRYSRCDEGEGS